MRLPDPTLNSVLTLHLQKLGWAATDLHRNSTEYPPSFKDGISRSYAFKLLSDPTTEERREVTRPMLNLIAHELAAFYEKQDERLEEGQKTGLSRKNVEFILNELLRAAGFAPSRWLRDRWDAIIGNPDYGDLRVGYFSWPSLADDDFSDTCRSRQCVEQLCRALSISAKIVPVSLTLAELYDRYLFERVDIIAPLIGLPSRRFTIAYSEPINGWNIGQVALVHEKFFGPDRPIPTQIGPSDLEDSKFSIHYVKGGVSELLIELLGLSPDHIHAFDSFSEAIESVLVAPDAPDSRYPVFVGDEIACQHALKTHGREVKRLLTEPVFARPLVFGLPTERPEVVATVNEGLSVLQDLGSLATILSEDLRGGSAATAKPNRTARTLKHHQ